jgi:hypothetical protein
MSFEKNIWIYWEQGWNNAPPICKICLDSWKQFNNNWKINILDKNNICDFIDISFIPNFWKINPIQIRADIIRTLLIQKYGGVWVDATLFCVKPLDEWLYDFFNINNNEDIFMFMVENKINVASNWFIACHKDNYIINTFRNNFIDKMDLKMDIHEYFEYYKIFNYLLLNDKYFNFLFYQNKKVYNTNAVKFSFLLNNFMGNNFDKLINNNSPVYKLTHKVKLNLLDNTFISNLIKYIGLDVNTYIPKNIEIKKSIMKIKTKINVSGKKI